MSTTPPPPDARISNTDALKYWSSVSPTISGMLGGYPRVSPTDIRGSKIFLAKLRKTGSSSPPKPLRRVVDCGAGIGRVAENFLTKVAEVVDIVEPLEKFAKEAEKTCLKGGGKMYVQGLEDWMPEEKYDLVWNQWCLGHLTDAQMVDYLKRCKEALAEDGWIVVKENMSTAVEGDSFDDVDSSVMRADETFRALFAKSGFKIVRTEVQMGFPKALYPVRMYALQPQELKEA